MKATPIHSAPVRRLEADVCVVGGGMAGVCAALAAARHGARTILIHDRPVLGGNASSEIRMWICGAHGPDNKEAGILEELLLENLYRNPMLLYPAWDHVLYGKCLEEPGLKTWLNCSVRAVAMEGARIRAVTAWHLTQQEELEIHARLFADCSGDSILRLSGAECRWGREGREEFGESHAPALPDRQTMGNSILLQLRAVDRHVPFIPPAWAHAYREEDLPHRSLMPDGNNFWWLEIGGTRDTIADADAIRDELLKIAYGVWALIKNHPDGRGHRWELDWIGSLPGKRENVRYVGDHVLTQGDIEGGGRFDDVVAHGGWPMDDHHPEAIRHPGEPTVFHPAPSCYGIPYRCLYSRNIENLFMAGRNIAATHMAMSSTRVMATCALMGQAVGTAAALAIRHRQTPRGILPAHLPELQATLLDRDVLLPGRPRPVSPRIQSAALTTSSGACADVLRNGIERDLSGQDNGWWGSAGDWVAYTWDTPAAIARVRLVLDSDFSDSKRLRCCQPRTLEPARMPAMLARDLDLECRDAQGRWQTWRGVRDNRRRLVLLEGACSGVTGLRLRLVRSWGGGRAHVFSLDV